MREAMGSNPIMSIGSLAERLTRCPAKALPIGCAGSNPAAVDIK
tara:strand:- start:51 stop:182 length:132 start_codon:yes stop_codon:yes gene_type:complete